MLKMFKKRLILLLWPLWLILYYGCDDTLTVQDVDTREIPDSNVSYKQDIAPIFELKCVNCHGNGRLEAGLDLTRWASFVDGRIVVPGVPDNSILMWTVEGITTPMPPPPTPALTINQIRGLRTWIDEGALNN